MGADADVGENHRPAEAEKLRTAFIGHLLAADGAFGNDAVIKARDELAEKQAALVALGEFDLGTGNGLPVLKERLDEGVVESGELADVQGEQAAHLFLHDLAREGGVEALEVLAGGLLAAQRFQIKRAAKRLGHRLCLVLGHQSDGVLLLLGVLLLRIGLLRAPTAVAIIATVVGVPAQDIPKLRPIEKMFIASVAGEDARGEEPRGGVAAGLLVLGLDLVRRQDAEMGEELLQSGNALPSGTGVAALAAVEAAFAGQTVVGTKGDGATTKNIGRNSVLICTTGRSDGLQHGPAEGAVANIEGEMEVRIGDSSGHKYYLLDISIFNKNPIGIKTKLGSADRALYPPCGYTGSKALLKFKPAFGLACFFRNAWS